MAIIGLALVGMGGLIFAGYWFNWSWTGLGPENSEPKQHMKTLWDWLQLLVIPLVLGIGGFWFSQVQKNNEQQIASDNQQAAILQTYLDRMSELLLEKGLRTSKADDEVRSVARAQTLTALRSLDAPRKRALLQFLYESDLINKKEGSSIVSLERASLHGANLRNAELEGANLNRTSLRNADLSGANLRKISLHRAKMSDADLNGATLCGADLSEADLSKVDLRNAHLNEANLTGANLSGANLERADLLSAKVTQEQLDMVRSLQGATMPDGSTHP